MNEIALENMFKEEDPPERVVQVSGHLGKNRYNGADVFGRTFLFYSSKKLVKNSFVVIQLGRYIEEATPFTTPEKFYV